jgi:hypothetical protein
MLHACRPRSLQLSSGQLAPLRALLDASSRLQLGPVGVLARYPIGEDLIQRFKVADLAFSGNSSHFSNNNL